LNLDLWLSNPIERSETGRNEVETNKLEGNSIPLGKEQDRGEKGGREGTELDFD
jgi:hypothetical protein